MKNKKTIEISFYDNRRYYCIWVDKFFPGISWKEYLDEIYNEE